MPNTPQIIAEWQFDKPGVAQNWVVAQDIANFGIKGGLLSGEVTAQTCFMMCNGLSFPTSPYQCLHMRVRAKQTGEGNMLWMGPTDPTHNWDRRVPFSIKQSGKWQDMVLYPFWQTEKSIIGLRIDLRGPGGFDIAFIRVIQWAEANSASQQTSWQFDQQQQQSWRSGPDPLTMFAPPVRLDLFARRYVTLKLRSSVSGTCRLVYAAETASGMLWEPFEVQASPQAQNYTVELQGAWPGRANWSWRDPIIALGVQIPDQMQGKMLWEGMDINARPQGPAEIQVKYFGFDEAINRAGRPSRIVAELLNSGGVDAPRQEISLGLPMGVKADTASLRQTVDLPSGGAVTRVSWMVTAESAKRYGFKLSVQGKQQASAQLQFMNAVELTNETAVPKPKPVKTLTDIYMYYFPGWEIDARWDCVRRVAPERKPWLGYYDETRPELVDWQIKAAVENGITGYILDWYWADGRLSLNYWLENYAKSRYRDMLKISLMWCNHVGVQNRDDFLKMVKYCIDTAFGWKSYITVDQKPLVVVWDSDRLRNGMGGSAAVVKLFAEADQLAVQAGYKGITFMESGMYMPATRARTEIVKADGYTGFMTYHDWWKASFLAPSSREVGFDDIVKTAEQTWDEKRKAASEMRYYPVLDSGWDPRPWHGDGPRAGRVINRTPELFEALLRKARTDWQRNKQEFILLGPANEWGEGSYIEPNVEYGFRMYEAVRNVFATTPKRNWPENIGPVDVGLPPIEFPPLPLQSSWHFDQSEQGWSPMMCITEFGVRQGALRFHSSLQDPAMECHARVEMRVANRLKVVMQISHPTVKTADARLFWGTPKGEFSIQASVGIPIVADGQMHSYTVDIPPAFRTGETRILRFDPCELAGADIGIASIELLP
ncbi:MAG: glycoside hydrolase family 99-like domain-containing protein [Armatimonadota bacterium]